MRMYTNALQFACIYECFIYGSRLLGKGLSHRLHTNLRAYGRSSRTDLPSSLLRMVWVSPPRDIHQSMCVVS